MKYSLLAIMALVDNTSAISLSREPLLTWKPKVPASHPVDYFVPEFGVDSDIADSQSNEKLTSAQLGVTWAPKKDEDGEWTKPMPTTTDSFDLFTQPMKYPWTEEFNNVVEVKK